MNSTAATLLVRAARQLFNNDCRGAIESYDKVIEIDPKNLIALQGRAFCKTLLLDEITPEESLVFLTIDIPHDLSSARFIVDEIAASLKKSKFSG
jgi:hypothetical protein